MNVERGLLIDAIRAHLLPEFVKLGFEVLPLSGKDAGGEVRMAFPFGRLRRISPNGFEMVEIQLHRRRHASFRLNVGIAPPNGVSHFTGAHIAQEDVWVHYLDQYYEVYKCPLFRQWFQIWHWPYRSVKKSNFDDLVGDVIGLLSEVELALHDGRCGSHIKCIKSGR